MVNSLLIVALSILPFSNFSMQSQSQAFREAREKFEKKEYLLAMIAAQRVTDEEKKNADFHYLYGSILVQLKQFSDADIHLRKAVALDSTNANLHYSLAAMLMQEQMETQALYGPNGMGMEKTSKKTDEIIQLLEHTLKLNPIHLKARLHLGRTFHKQNMRSKAFQEFAKVADKDPKYPWVHYHLATIQLDAGKLMEAIQSFKKEIQYHPSHGQARLELGDLLFQTGEFKQALLQLKAANQENVSLPDLHYGLAKVHKELGQYKEAIEAIHQCVKLVPEVPIVHQLLAELYYQMGKIELGNKEMKMFEQLKKKITITYTN